MIFAKTKKKERELRKIRFIEATLRSFLRDVRDIESYPSPFSIEKKFEKINIMIEIRTREIRDWI